MENIYELSKRLHLLGRTYVHLEGNTKMAQIAHAISIRQHLDYDVMALITGDEGTGKSTLGIEMQISVSSINQIPFSFKKNILFSPDYNEIKTAFLGFPRYAGIHPDEAIKILFNRKWSDKPQKDLIEMIALIRQKNFFMTPCMPKLSDFDPYVRKGRAPIWMHVIRRGLALVFGKNPNPFNPKEDDAFNSDAIYKEINQMGNKAYNIAELVRTLKRINNYWGFLLYKDLPPKYAEAYKRLKSKLSLPSDNPKEDENNNLKMIKNAIKSMFEEGMSSQAIASKLKGDNPDYLITPYKVTRLINTMKEESNKKVDGDKK